MQHYELMFIVDPAAEEGFDEVKQKIEGIITGREGSVVSFEKLGKKRLAYPVAKRQYGVYFLVNFKGNGRIVQALDYFLRLHPQIIRHIIIAFSEKQLALRQRTESVLAEEAERMRLGGRPLAKSEDHEIETVEGETVVTEELTEEFGELPDTSVTLTTHLESEPEPEPSGDITDDLKATIME